VVNVKDVPHLPPHGGLEKEKKYVGILENMFLFLSGQSIILKINLRHAFVAVHFKRL